MSEDTKLSLADYEKTKAKIDEIVTRLEDPNQNLEAAFKDFEQGVALIKSCQQLLNEAEQKVQIMLGEHIAPFEGFDEE